MMPSTSAARPVSETLRDYGRGAIGGLLFSLPLLYTMEVWWSGFVAYPERILVFLLGGFAVIAAYNRFAGLHPETDWHDVLLESIESLGLGLFTALALLLLTSRIDGGTSFDAAIGMTTVEAVMAGIGVSIGVTQLDGRDDDDGEETTFLGEIAIALLGATLLAANIAPTEEVLVIAIESSSVRLLLILLLSIVTTAIILFFSNFPRSAAMAHVDSRVEMLLVAAVTYGVAFSASAAMLWFFGRYDGVGFDVALAQTVVLAFPASLGAAAGRLLLRRG